MNVVEELARFQIVQKEVGENGAPFEIQIGPVLAQVVSTGSNIASHSQLVQNIDNEFLVG